MEACYGGTDVMERSCAMARGKDINTQLQVWVLRGSIISRTGNWGGGFSGTRARAGDMHA
jgi:hypothetical protein